jgi:hypothetical protein
MYKCECYLLQLCIASAKTTPPVNSGNRLPCVYVKMAVLGIHIQCLGSGVWAYIVGRDPCDSKSSRLHQCSRLKPSYEFHFEGLSNVSPVVERLVQI